MPSGALRQFSCGARFLPWHGASSEPGPPNSVHDGSLPPSRKSGLVRVNGVSRVAPDSAAGAAAVSVQETASAAAATAAARSAGRRDVFNLTPVSMN